MSIIGKFIKQKREQKHLTQKQMSDLLGYENPQFISLMENGHSKIPLNILGQLLSILSIPEKKAIDLLVESYRAEAKASISAGRKKSG